MERRMDGWTNRWMDGQKNLNIEVGVPTKNIILLKYAGIDF